MIVEAEPVSIKTWERSTCLPLWDKSKLYAHYLPLGTNLSSNYTVDRGGWLEGCFNMLVSIKKLTTVINQ